MATIGDRIRARRRQLGMTLDQVSMDTSIPKSTIQRWESGAIKNMGQAGLQKIAVSLNTTIDWLLTGKETQDGTRKLTLNELLFEYLCRRNHFFLSEDRTTIYREAGTVTLTMPIEENTVKDLLDDTVDYFGYILSKRSTLYRNGEVDEQEYITEVYR